MRNVTLSRPFDLAETLRRARTASRTLARADRDGALLRIADALLERRAEILAANAEDVAAEEESGVDEAEHDEPEVAPQKHRGDRARIVADGGAHRA